MKWERFYYINWEISGGAKRGAKLSSNTSRLRVSRSGTNIWLSNKCGGSGSKGFGLVGSDGILLGVLIRRIAKCNDHCYFNWLSAWLPAKVPN